ncbi:MAG TPA: hypothetical protein VEM77_06830 [Thermoplasmata archaeon]|nr:hypothetical protein [Thermoplasmata archaeon]
MTGTPARAALYSIWRWISERGHEDKRRFMRRERPPAPWSVRSSRTIAALRASANCTSLFETKCSL